MKSRMIRVVNLDLMGDFSGRVCGRGLSSCRIRSFLLVVSGRTGGYDDLGERVRCVFMGGRDLEPSRTHREQNSIYRMIQSPRSVSFRSLNGQWPISKTQREPAF